jgi:hypothetical protein
VAPSAPRPLARIHGESRVGIGQAGEPPGLPRPHVVCHGLGCFPWRRCLGLGWLLGQLTRMHAHNTHCLRGDAPIAVLDLHLSAPPVARPAPGRLVGGPPGFLHQPGPRGWRAPPSVEFLPASPRARDTRDEIALARETYPQGPATRGLTIRDEAPPSLQSPRQTLRHGDGGFHPIPAVAISQAHAQGDRALPAHTEAQQDLCAIGPPLLARPRGRARRSWGLRFVCRGPIACHGRRILMAPRWRDRLDRQRCEGNPAKPLLEIRGTPRLKEVSHAGIIERGSCQPRRQPR